MSASLSVHDIKAQYIINVTLMKLVRGPLYVAAERLNKIWWEQLPDRLKKEIEIANGS